MVFFKKKRPYIRITPPKFEEVEKNIVPAIPDNLFQKCPSCGKTFSKEHLTKLKECPYCQYGYRLTSQERLDFVLDKDSFQETNPEITTKDPLQFPGYLKKLSDLEEKTHEKEAVMTGFGTIRGEKTAIGVMDAHFLMGSMGQAVGEKITRLFEEATKEKLPVILYCASGGARMQEGIFSLMQMAKVTQAVKRHSEAGLFYLAFLTDPTTGGVTASFAMEGDITLAEPGALIAFAGPRVIKQTTHQELPEGFQKAEFLLEHGFLDQVVPRKNQREVLSTFLKIHHRKEEKNEK